MDEREEIKEMQRRAKLKGGLQKEVEQLLEIERKKWEKKFTLELSNSVFLTIRDNKGDQKDFILVSVREKNGVLGQPMKVDLKYLIKLGTERKLKFTPWIFTISFGLTPFFRFAPDHDDVTASPTFLLAQNHDYVENVIDPYNVELAGFLFINYPKFGNFLEAVSGSVVGNISVIENLMKRNKEPYKRQNHLLNWLHYFLSKDSRKISFQVFSMHERWIPSYSKYLEKFKT